MGGLETVGKMELWWSTIAGARWLCTLAIIISSQPTVISLSSNYSNSPTNSPSAIEVETGTLFTRQWAKKLDHGADIIMPDKRHRIDKL
jgi:hypothetical protein